MAGRTTSFAKGKGTTCIAGLTLKSVLYVFDLKCNLLSVSKLTKEKGCLVTFFQSYCVFQYLFSGKMIGSTKEKGGLYQTPRLDHSTRFRSPIQSSLFTILE